MCGIIGATSSVLVDFEVQMVRDLLVVSNLRGRFGAGAICVSPKEDITVARTIGNGVDLLDNKEFVAATYGKPHPSTIIGHTRWPTKGSWGETAHIHPHEAGDLVGVHNGTMETILRTKVPDADDISDSALLFDAMARVGPAEALRTSKGAYALVWIDKKDKTLNFLRNDERPLVLAEMEGNPGTLFWASEASMLGFVIRRHRPTNKIKFMSLDPGEWLKYRMINPGGRVGYIEKTEVKYVEPPRVKIHRKGKKGGDKSARQYETYPHHFLFEDNLKMALGIGCSYCGKSHSMEDYLDAKTHWISSSDFLCTECVQGEASAWKPHHEATPTRH